MKKIPVVAWMLLLGMIYISCGKDEPQNIDVYAVEIYLTDDPLQAEEVNIEILSVILKGEDESHEIELNTLSGIYNLLDFQGDIDTLIASGNYDLEKIKEIRVILGNNNSIKIDGQLYPLEIPSGSESGLKIKVDEELTGKDLVSLLIDFDACESVREVNGDYKLSPVIHFKGDRNRKDLEVDDVAGLDSCYTIEFPVTVKNLDGSESSVNSQEEWEELLDNGLVTGIVYPFNVIDPEGNSHKVNNANQAKKLVESCGKDGEQLDFNGIVDSILVCYVIQYPLTVELEDGNTTEVMNNEELKALQGASGLVFPFYMTDDEGEMKKVNNLNQLEGLLRNCANDDDDDDDPDHHGDDDIKDLVEDILDCFEIVFPLEVIDADSMNLTIDSLEQLIKEIKSGNVHGFASEFKVIDAEGNEIIIDSMESLFDLLESCVADDYHNEIFEKLKDCIEFEFPLTIEKSGEEILVEDLESLIELFASGEDCRFVFPFHIKEKNGMSQKAKKISNGNLLRKLLEDCE